MEIISSLNESPELIAQEFACHCSMGDQFEASMKVLSLLLRNATKMSDLGEWAEPQ